MHPVPTMYVIIVLICQKAGYSVPYLVLASKLGVSTAQAMVLTKIRTGYAALDE